MEMPGSDPIRLPKKAEVVARRIAAAILDEGLEPGTPLPKEPEMLAEYQIARSTLREALRLLETQGVLSLQAGRSPIVRRPTADELVNSLTLLLQFRGATFETLLRARTLFEPPIASEAARRRDPASIAALRRNIAAAREEADASLVIRARRELAFHRLIANASASPLADVMVATLTTILANEFDPHDVDHDFESELQVHEALVDAIEQGNERLAEELMRAHVQAVVDEALLEHPQLAHRPVRWL